MEIKNPLDIEIIPGILEKEWENIEKKFEIIKPFAKKVHIDLLDGVFAPNTTFLDPQPFSKYAGDFDLEIHMMVDDPAKYLKPFAAAGFKRFIGQIEKMPDIAEFLAEAEDLNEVGLAVDSETEVDKIFPYIEDLDFAFVMTVKAGFSNQSFIPEMVEKIKKIREKDGLIPIEIDGGVSDQTIIDAKNAGATRFISTGFLFNSADPQRSFERLKELTS